MVYFSTAPAVSLLLWLFTGPLGTGYCLAVSVQPARESYEIRATHFLGNFRNQVLGGFCFSPTAGVDNFIGPY
jgi:hypothetical protein